MGITNVTFYRHFPTKDDLIVAYLEKRAASERAAVHGGREAAGEPLGALRMIVGGIGQESCTPGFRGRPFINAAAEYPDPEHPARLVVDAHRHWFQEMATEMLDELGVTESSHKAAQLITLRDGAMVAGYLGHPASVAVYQTNVSSCSNFAQHATVPLRQRPRGISGVNTVRRDFSVSRPTRLDYAGGHWAELAAVLEQPLPPCPGDGVATIARFALVSSVRWSVGAKPAARMQWVREPAGQRREVVGRSDQEQRVE